jgi:DNA-binding transcriptional ArsR family regulator
MSSAARPDILLHPVRIRIALTLQRRWLTTAEIHRLLPDIPLPSLYRHLNQLMEAKIIRIAETQQVHSNQERVYTLVESAEDLTAEEISRATPEEQLRYFTVFVTGLLSLYDRYLQSNPTNIADNIMYYAQHVFLTDDQYTKVRTQMRGLIKEALQQPPAPGARRQTLAVLAFPEGDVLSEETQS